MDIKLSQSKVKNPTESHKDSVQNQQTRIEKILAGPTTVFISGTQNTNPFVASTTGNSKSIISLSKLKNYMPHSQMATQLLHVRQNQVNNVSPTGQSVFKQTAYHYGNNLSGTSSFLNLHQQEDKTVRARTQDLNSNLTCITADTDRNTSSQSHSTGKQSNELENQRRQSLQRALRNSIPVHFCGQARSGGNTEGVESVEGDFRQQQQQRTDLDTSNEDRKRKRSNFQATVAANGNQDSIGKAVRSGEDGRTSSRNNMTPSSLLSLSNHHSYGEQHQSRHCTIGNDSDYHDTPSDLQGKDDDLIPEQARLQDGKSTIRDNQNQASHSCTIQASASASSSSSLMLADINQFKSLEGIGNSSASKTQTSGSSINDLNAFDYSTNPSASQISNQITGVLASVDSFQQTYQPNSASYDVKSSNGSQSNNYAGSHGRLSCGSYSNLSASMLGQQIKFESPGGCGVMIDDHNALVVDHNNSITRNPNIGSLTAAKVQQQARSHFNQYYHNHYNFMPASSSKSSSPTSSSSTPPPPKSLAMHPNTSQHSNQHATTLVTTSSSQSVQNHLDQLSQHYMSEGSHPMNQHQNQLNTHYVYNQNSNGNLGVNHSNLPSHDQTYEQHNNHHQQQVIPNQQSIYHHLTGNTNVGLNHIYANHRGATHYQTHLSNGMNSGHQSGNHLVSGAHQGNLNSAAAHAAAVVSQTLKTVANQHNHYASSMTNGFGPPTGAVMNISSQHHQALESVGSLNHLTNQACIQQSTHQAISIGHAASVATRKYQCKMCPQVFMSKAELKYHNQNHMREAKPYKCMHCPKAFANSSYLSQHMRIHQGVKPYSCDTCSRKFTQLSHLQQHKRTHTGDKPYKCNYLNCTKQFSQLSNLQSHSRCHQLDKPYKCNSCYKCFHDEQSLLEHIPRHLESKHLKKNLCIFCGSSYQQERGLVKHFQQYHTDKSPTLVAAAIAAGTTGNTNLIASLISSRTPNAFPAQSNGNASGTTNFGSNSSGNLNSGGHLVSNSTNSHEIPAARYNMFG